MPGARERAQNGELCFGTINSWLAFKLCGRHVTDVSNASRTMLYNIHTMRWDPVLFDLFGVPEAMLPEVVRSSGQVGVAREEWFGGAIPVSGIAGDQQAATFGQACYDKGMVKNTYGTGCFMLMHSGYVPPVSRNRLLATIGWKIDGAPTTCSRAASSWAAPPCKAARRTGHHQGIKRGRGAGDLGAGQRRRDAGAGLCRPRRAALGPVCARHDCRHDARHDKAHIARAAIEAIAYQSAELLTAMQKDAACPVMEVRAEAAPRATIY